MSDTPIPSNGPMAGSMKAGMNKMASSARHTIDVSMDGKASQNDAGYQPQSPDPAKMCDDCQSFVNPGSCLLVAGDIAPQGTCTLWQPEKGESPAEDAAEGQAPDAMPAPTGGQPR